MAFLAGFLLASLFYFYIHRSGIRDQSWRLVKGDKLKGLLTDSIEQIENTLKLSLSNIHHPENFEVLIFGPSLPQPKKRRDAFHVAVWRKRELLREALKNLGFKVAYGEDLGNAGEDDIIKQVNVAVKEIAYATMVQAIIVLAAGEGPATEVGMFSQHPNFCRMMVIAIHANHLDSFLAKTAEAFGTKLVSYTDNELHSCSLQSRLIAEAIRLYGLSITKQLVFRPTFR